MTSVARPPRRGRYNESLKRWTKVLDAQLLHLQQIQLEHDLQVAREQVLVDNLYQLGAISVFREFMKQRCCLDGTSSSEADSAFQGEQQQQQQQSPAATAFQHGTSPLTSYAGSLLQSMQPITVQEVLSWDAGGWCNFFKQTSAEISTLLQVSARDAAGPEQQQYQQQLQGQQHDGDGAAGVQQRLSQVVDRLAATGLVGSMFGDKIGQQLGACTSTNHITMCQETPPPDHWRRVLLRLQPSYSQLLQLAAGFQEFVRLRKASKEMQLSLTAQVECSRSCNSQTLVAASMRTGGGSASAGTPAATARGAAAAAEASATAAAGGGIGRGRSGSPCTGSLQAGGAGGTGAAAAAAGGGGPDYSGATESWTTPTPAAAAPACSSLMDQLLRTLNQAFVMVQALMLNTLTRRQIAELVVSSFPYVPRPAPLMEAAHELLVQRRQQQQRALAETGSPGCKAAASSLGLSNVPGTPAPAAAAAAAAAGRSAGRSGSAEGTPPFEGPGSVPAAAAAGAEEAGAGLSAADDVAAHMAQRLELLQQQVQHWWFSELQHLQLQEEPSQGSW